jgi:hypothetical protein
VTQIYHDELYADVKALERLLTDIGTLRFAPRYIVNHAQAIRRGMRHLQQVLKAHGNSSMMSRSTKQPCDWPLLALCRDATIAGASAGCVRHAHARMSNGFSSFLVMPTC